MNALDKALELLGSEPLPADAYQRLAAIEAEATAQERERFGDLWEAFYAAGGVDPDEDC